LQDLAERIESELFEVNFEQVRKMLETARNIRTRLVREAGLQEFRILEWDPYYVKLDTAELCIMVPRGVRPNSLARLTQPELEKRVVVLNKHQIRWKKLWPP